MATMHGADLKTACDWLITEHDWRASGSHTRGIEFVGFPGVGKSTLAKALIDELERRDIPFSPVLPNVPPARLSTRAFQAALATVRWPRTMGTAALGSLINGQLQPTDHLSSLVQLGRALQRLETAGGSRKQLVVDEGPFHALWSTRFLVKREAYPAPRLDRWYQELGISAWSLVHIDLPAETAFRRVVQREDQRGEESLHLVRPHRITRLLEARSITPQLLAENAERAMATVWDVADALSENTVDLKIFRLSPE